MRNRRGDRTKEPLGGNTVETFHETMVCSRCSERRPLDPTLWRCPACGGPFSIQAAYRFMKPKILQGPYSLWRYQEAIPFIAGEAIVTLGEGFTPLVPTRFGGSPVFFKLDFLQPTGSFKDRGASVLVSFLKQGGVRHVIEDSSGNAGASLAAYAARAGIRCTIFVPASASKERLVQIRTYGADVIPVPGPREEAAKAALKAAEETCYAGHNWHPLFLEGVKTQALEIWEQLGWQAPDNLILPTGYGSQVLGAFAAFSSLLQAGEVSKLPRLFAVQAKRCSPLYPAWASGHEEVEGIRGEETLAEGIACQKPVRGRELLAAIRGSKGAVEVVEEEEIIASLKDLAAQGLSVEPTAAVAAAAFRRLVGQGKIQQDETTVVVLTGSGLKATEKLSRIFQDH